jgi:thiosulfate/3-mercaptopyruvate sulfurtransferase
MTTFQDANNARVLIDAAEAIALVQGAALGGAPCVLLDTRFELSDPSAGERTHVASHPIGSLYAHLDREGAGPRAGHPRSTTFTGRHPLPSRDALAATLGRWGIKPSTQVITFDSHGSSYAARWWWLLRWLGHHNVMVLNGGLAPWMAAGGAMTDQATAVVALSPYPTLPAAMPTVDVQAIAKPSTRMRLIDARAADRFAGLNETIDPVAGHIPGALNRCFRDNLDAQGHFKTVEALRSAWAPLLAAPEGTTIVQQCGSGVTACQNIAAVMHAGGPITALYAGSWSEWSADASRPLALGA